MKTIRLFQAFQDGMVLQRDQANTIWGQCLPDRQLAVRYPGGSLAVTSGPDGYFEGRIPALPAGGPYSITVSYAGTRPGQAGSDSEGSGESMDSLEIHDVWSGDVFILAGQSNMELPLSRTMDRLAPYFESFSDPLIREFRLPIVPVFGREASDWPEGGSWKPASGEFWPNMGALGVCFARHYRENEKVPVGLINMAVGGSPAESWLPPALLTDEPGWLEVEAQCQDEHYVRKTQERETGELNRWYAELNEKDSLWQIVEKSLSERPGPWEPYQLPGMLLGTPYENRQGSFWMRKIFHLSGEEIAKAESGPLKLYFGALIDADAVFLNGEKIGQTDYQYPPRRYPVPQRLLREGDNEILVRLIVNRNTGGTVPGRFYGFKNEDFCLDLRGDWDFQAAAAMPVLPQMTFFQYMPCGLYQSFVAPARNLKARGTLWYQGESNTGRPQTYEKLFGRVIQEFQAVFGGEDPDLHPFVFVQLTSFQDADGQMDPDGWPLVREAQRRCLDLPGTGMVVSTDAGERHDLHPQDKWTLGKRADLVMRSLLGLHSGEAAGPEPDKVRQEGNSLILSFNHAEGGLIPKGDLHKAFRFLIGGRLQEPLDAAADGTEVRLVLPEGVAAEEVRYAWENCPLDYALYNKEGLPASPFRIKL